MWAAVCMAALWLLIALTDTAPAPVRLGMSSIAFGFLLAWYIPASFKNRHVKSQNRLLDRCRALLILGSQELEIGNKAAADDALRRIRRLESRWRVGDSLSFRLSLMLWAVAWAVIACIAIRFLGAVASNYGWTGKLPAVKESVSDLWVAALISMSAPIYALVGYFEAWTNPWAIENCGDRLWQLIYGPRGVEPAPDQITADVPDFDGMTPREIFGLGQNFTLRELDRARRALVRELHPDRWQSVNSQELAAREEALKRVNAAYDVLRRQMT